MSKSLAFMYSLKKRAGKPMPRSTAEDMDTDSSSDTGSMVDRIMTKRKKYSEGGMVANGGEDDLDKMADGRPNEFDDLALRDDLEFSYTGANSGDELGNDSQDADREKDLDMVARIMRSRARR